MSAPIEAPRPKAVLVGVQLSGVTDAEQEDETEPLDRATPPAPTGAPRATVVVIDHELSPRQLRNIEGATSAAEVLDRAGVIIEIFHRHASSRPARLQVEIARLTYVAPRVRETGGGERQRGGIALRGAGESSLMRALTGSHVLVADKLFATLDTTVRALWPESRPRILVSDTVGFIKKLPHDLVA